MKYYNIHTYNYDSLNNEDKRFIDGFQYAASVVRNKETIFDDLDLSYKDDIMSRIKKEVISEALDAVALRLENVQPEIIVGMIDQYPEE